MDARARRDNVGRLVLRNEGEFFVAPQCRVALLFAPRGTTYKGRTNDVVVACTGKRDVPDKSATDARTR